MEQWNGEPEDLHTSRIARLATKLFDHTSRPGMIGGEDIGQRRGIVANTSLPRNLSQIRAVVHAKVCERNEVPLIDGVPDSQLRCDLAPEVAEDVETIRPLGRRRQRQKLSRLDQVQKCLIRRRCRMVKLVDDHDIEVRGVERFQPCAVDALDGGEHMLKRGGTLPADPQFAEARITQGMREGRPTRARISSRCATKSSRARAVAGADARSRPPP